jgi:ABC transport system ATP-binding/permease protein
MLKLVIQDDEGKTTVVPLVRDEITIGREEGNTIRLTERNVSRRHARLRRANGSITIEDLESYNGVRVNGSLIEGELALAESDRVQIGDYLIELRAEDVERADSEQATQRIERLDPEELAAERAAPEAADDARTVPLPKPRLAAAPEANGAATTTKSSPPPAPPVSAEASHPRAPAVDRASSPDLQPHGKLVVLSTVFAGREFVLDKPSIVLGRTEDNDVCLDHRSISRHHAKVVHEDGRYSIVDLQSSNGVRVNGEEYGKVELRRGDVVDLGHVRMRYVEPGEDFVFGRDAQPVDLESGRRRGALWAGGAILLLASVGGVYAFTGGFDRAASLDDETESIAAIDDDGTDEGISAVVAQDAASTEVVDLEGDDADRVLRHLEAANEAMAAERWEEARDEAREALALDPDDERVLELATRAEAETANRGRYEAFQDAVEAGDFRAVASMFAEIDRESVYRVRGQPEHDRMRDEYVEQVQRRANLAARRGQCDQLRRIAADARAIWPEAGDAAAQVPCRRIAEATPDRTASDPESPEPPDDAGRQQGGGSSAAASQPSVDEVVAEAQSAARAGEFGRAMRLCEDALRRSRGHSEALMVCLISACNLRNVSKAKRYMSQISGDQRIYARQICLRHGVDVE